MHIMQKDRDDMKKLLLEAFTMFLKYTAKPDFETLGTLCRSNKEDEDVQLTLDTGTSIFSCMGDIETESTFNIAARQSKLIKNVDMKDDAAVSKLIHTFICILEDIINIESTYYNDNIEASVIEYFGYSNTIEPRALFFVAKAYLDDIDITKRFPTEPLKIKTTEN